MADEPRPGKEGVKLSAHTCRFLGITMAKRDLFEQVIKVDESKDAS
jgi:hypothetical protein